MTDISSLPDDNRTPSKEEVDYVRGVLSPENIKEHFNKTVKKAKGFFDVFRGAVLVTLLLLLMVVVLKTLALQWKVLITFVVSLIIFSKCS